MNPMVLSLHGVRFFCIKDSSSLSLTLNPRLNETTGIDENWSKLARILRADSIETAGEWQKGRVRK